MGTKMGEHESSCVWTLVSCFFFDLVFMTLPYYYQ